MRNNKNQTYFWALIFVIGGSVLLMRNLEMIDFNIPFKIRNLIGWQLIPLIIGINALLKQDYVKGISAISIAIIFYIPQFLNDADRIQYFKLWPLLLVGVGIAIFAKHLFPKKYNEFTCLNKITDLDIINENNIMAGSSKKFVTKNFKGGNVTCIMGGSEINFTEADLQNNSVLEVFVLMGGIEMRIPKEWNVKMEVFPLMGGVEDQITKFPDNVVESDKLLILKGWIIMGGVEIKRY